MSRLDASIKTRLSKQERAWLARQAEKEGRTASSIVRLALVRYLVSAGTAPADAVPTEPEAR